jgi:lipopolysaccharide transport system permease protein
MINQIVVEGWKTRRAWWFTASSRSRERYARTRLGSLWFGISCLLTVGLLATVYSKVFNVGNFREYTIYLGIGVTVWNAVSMSIGAAAGLMRTHGLNIKNRRLGVVYYVLEEWAFQVQTLGQSVGLVLLAMIAIQPTILINLVVNCWLPALNILLLILWLPCILAIAGAYIEDIYQIIPIALQTLFLVSPIIYKKESLGAFKWLAESNVLFLYIEQFRTAAMHGTNRYEVDLALFIINLIGTSFGAWIIRNYTTNLAFLV